MASSCTCTEVKVQEEKATTMASDGSSEKMTKMSGRRRCSTTTKDDGEHSLASFSCSVFPEGDDDVISNEPVSSSLTAND